MIVAWLAARPAFLAWRPLTFTGQISYGLYLFHFPIAFGPLNYLDGLSALPRTIAIVVVSYGLAATSSFLIERRFRVQGRSNPVPASPAPPVQSLATA